MCYGGLTKCFSIPHFTYTLLMDFSYLQAAKETGALKEAKDKLEKQVEDLTLRVQLEKRRRVNNFLVTKFLWVDVESCTYMFLCLFYNLDKFFLKIISFIKDEISGNCSWHMLN